MAWGSRREAEGEGRLGRERTMKEDGEKRRVRVEERRRAGKGKEEGKKEREKP